MIAYHWFVNHGSTAIFVKFIFLVTPSSWQVQWAALKKIECLLDVILAAGDQAAMQARRADHQIKISQLNHLIEITLIGA